jgi:hypothetical protein
MGRIGLFSLVLACTLSVASLAENGQWEAQGSLETVIPSGDLWDKAIGGELKLIYWKTPELGFAYSIGISQWSADEKTVPVSPDVSRSWGGDARYIPLGVSVIMRRGLANPRLSYTLEAGLSYFVCNSSLTLTETTQIPIGGGDSVEEKNTYDADCNGGFVARVAGGLEWNWTRQSRIFMKAGYQLDVDKGEATVDWLNVHQDLELGGFFAQLGVGIPF